jgi:hypothetical protein
MITVANYCKYQDSAESAGQSKDLKTDIRWDIKLPLIERSKEVKKEETTIEGKNLSLLSETNPNGPYVSVADHLRSEVLAAGGKCPGWRTDRAYMQHHRAELAKAVQYVASRFEIPLARQREVISWAVRDQQTWGDAKEWSWLRVLDSPAPANCWRQKAAKVAAAYDRAQSQPARKPYMRPYYPGPGAQGIPVYYDADGHEITVQEYRRMGGNDAK